MTSGRYLGDTSTGIGEERFVTGRYGHQMKVAYVDVFQNLPANSGNDWYSLQLLTDLIEAADVHLYHTQTANGKRGYMPKNTAIKQDRIPPKIAWNRIRGNKIARRLEQLRPEMLLDKSSVKSVDADVVFARVYSYHIARHIAKANDAPLVLVMQNIEWEYLKYQGYSPLIYVPARFYEKYLLKKADAVTTISPVDYDYATAHAFVGKVFYVPYEPNNQVFGAGEALSYDYGKDKLNVLFYGSLDRSHNVNALKFIKQALIPKLKQCGLFDSTRINVFGSGTPPQSLDLENDPDINFLGSVRSPEPYVRGSDVVIVPVRNGGGVKVRVLESLSCNKPTIAFPEATFGLESKFLAAVTVANGVDGFVEALKSVALDSSRATGSYCVHSSANVASALDAAHYALKHKAIWRKVRYRRFALSNIFKL